MRRGRRISQTYKGMLMSDFTFALADVRRVTGLGDFAARSILTKPKPLPYVKAEPGPHGGNSQRL